MVDTSRAGRSAADSLEWGAFHDEVRTYRVRASSADAPDSFQVYTSAREDIVLIISGINSGDLKATWGPSWRGFEPDWRAWVEDSAFRVFYSSNRTGATARDSARFCGG